MMMTIVLLLLLLLLLLLIIIIMAIVCKLATLKYKSVVCLRAPPYSPTHDLVCNPGRTLLSSRTPD